MKNAAVPTTTAKGAAVSRSRITAVQSVYIAADENRGHHPRWSPLRSLSRRLLVKLLPLPHLLVLALLSQALLPAAPARAGVAFDNCQPTADGGITCDTRPTGNTRMDELDARYGLLDEASPGWNEFEPFEGDDDLFGGNET
jgi:hypothetical protein